MNITYHYLNNGLYKIICDFAKIENGFLKMRSAIQIVKCIRKLQRDDERERRRGRF